MSKNRHKNQYGTFAVGGKGYKKYLRVFSATILVVVFVFGTGTLIYKKMNRSETVQTAVQQQSEIPGWWYQKYFSKSTCASPVCAPDADPDSDGLTNAQEYYYHTDPFNHRTIGDKLNDGELVALGFDPSRPGRMTFDEAASDDNILSESLLLDVDLKKMVAEDLDINRVNLFLVSDDELHIIPNASAEDYMKYSEDVKAKVEKYFPASSFDLSVEILKTGEGASLEEVRRKASLLSSDLKSVSVPQQLLMFHKYNISIYQLVSDVTNLQGQGTDEWFDKAQALLAAQQRLNLEKQRLLLLNI